MQIDEIRELFDKLNLKLDRMADPENECWEHFRKLLESFVSKLNDSNDLCKINALKLNSMINELKGVVAMSRAALDEGRKFTEMLELPRICVEMETHLHQQKDLLYKLRSAIDDIISRRKDENDSRCNPAPRPKPRSNRKRKHPTDRNVAG